MQERNGLQTGRGGEQRCGDTVIPVPVFAKLEHKGSVTMLSAPRVYFVVDA